MATRIVGFVNSWNAIKNTSKCTCDAVDVEGIYTSIKKTIGLN